MAYFRTTLLVLLGICAALFVLAFGLVVVGGIDPGIGLIWNVLSALDVNFALLPASVSTSNPYVFAASLIDAFIFALLAVVLAALFFDAIKRFNVRERLLTSRIRKLRDHVIIVPFNNFAQSLAAELAQMGQKRVTIAKSESDLGKIYRLGELGLVGDPETVEIFEIANAPESRYIVTCSENDIENALITVTAKTASAHSKIVSRVSSIENISKLGSAGAYRMVMPEVTAGEELGEQLVKIMLRG